jgi:hypothetical protein
MQLAMIYSADWNGELVAHASSECTRLCKREVMRIGWEAAAHKAELPEHKPAVLLITITQWFCPKHGWGRREGASAPRGSFLPRACVSAAGGHHALVDFNPKPVE